MKKKPMTVLERIEAHSYRDDDCLIWTGHTDHAGVPRAGYKRNGRWVDTPVRRAYCLEKGMKLTKDQHVLTKCGHPQCVAPDHIRVVSRKQHLSEYLYKIHTGAANILRSAKLAEAKRVNCKTGLTIDDVRRMRLEGMTIKQAMAEFNISRAMAHSILNNKCWRDYHSPFIQLIAA